MSILALEPNPLRAATIRDAVCDVVGAELTLVKSKSDLLQALEAGIPDLILLSALLSPSDETELLSHLSTLKDSGHVELLFTPFLFAVEAPPAAAPRGWRRWLKRQAPSTEEERGCEPQAFAEQIRWSLRRAEEARRNHAERNELQREELQREIDEAQQPVVEPYSDRRAYLRFPADQLQGLRSARIKNGPNVKLVDCSSGGALIESEEPLQPDSEALLELVGEHGGSIVPFRVIRSNVGAGESRQLYWGACAFTRPLELADLLRPASADATSSQIEQTERLDISVKTIVNRYVSLTSIRNTDATELVAALQAISRARPIDPVSGAIDGLLAVVISALQEGEERAITIELIEKHLDVALPWMAARFVSASSSVLTPGAEVFYLKVPHVEGADAQVLNVELPQGSLLEDWQFRLLEASAHLAALAKPSASVDVAPTDVEMPRPISGRDRRRYVRIQGRFDGRRLGGVSLPILIHDISIAGCFVDSLHEEQEGRQLTLEIQLPEAAITVKAEVVCSRPGFGFAVRFLDMAESAHACLARLIAARAGSLMHSPSTTEFSQSMIA